MEGMHENIQRCEIKREWNGMRLRPAHDEISQLWKTLTLSDYSSVYSALKMFKMLNRKIVDGDPLSLDLSRRYFYVLNTYITAVAGYKNSFWFQVLSFSRYPAEFALRNVW